jgi:hypothetical protein
MFLSYVLLIMRGCIDVACGVPIQVLRCSDFPPRVSP